MKRTKHIEIDCHVFKRQDSNMHASPNTNFFQRTSDRYIN